MSTNANHPIFYQYHSESITEMHCSNSLSAQKAVLVFTHSEILLRAAGVVHVMEGGVIVESGEYSTLKSLTGLTARKESS